MFAKSKNFLKTSMPTIAIIAILLAVFFYYKYYQLQKNPVVASQQEVQSLVAKVGKLVLLPEGETPTIATVSDPEALKDQPFFTNAVKGDKVLIYPQAKKAILYSVSMNKVIETAPLNIGSNTKGVTTTNAKTTTPEKGTTTPEKGTTAPAKAQ